ncbi:MAG: flagellar hook-basal body complex protein [Spirochaetia bacterium]|nr:flagellar hook-basal body complex protein [Spirochaetia bacterium]
MMGSLYSSISGLKNHTTWMSVIGNNISNVNTVGYKEQRVTFKTQLSQSLGSASGANAGSNLGGINPVQLGLGASMGSIDNIMTQGALQTTGNALDVAITGKGFFTVKSGATTTYTRAGNFSLDNDGNLVTSSGSIVQGWQGGATRTLNANSVNPINQISASTYDINTDQPAQGIKIASDLTMQAQASTEINIAGNLDSLTGLSGLNPAINLVGCLPAGNDFQNAAAGVALATINDVATGTGYFVDATGTPVTPDAASSQTVYDSLGNPHTITFWFFQSADLQDPPPPPAAQVWNRPTWQWYAFDTTNAAPSHANCLGGTGIEDQADQLLAAPTGQVNSLIWFNPDGSLASNGGSQETVNAGAATAGVIQTGAKLVLPWHNNAQGLAQDGAIGDQIIEVNFGTSNAWATPPGGAPTPVQVNNGTNSAVLSDADLGLRDGATGDVSGSYQVVGGASTYVPVQSVYGKSQDGYRAGSLLSLSVDSTGAIVGTFSNEKSLAIAKLAIATFQNEQGLASVGGTAYATTSNSGDARLSTAGTAGAGTTVGGSLEASNVDLSVELTNMIVAQRGFESNARIVTTSSDMLDTLVNLGR